MYSTLVVCLAFNLTVSDLICNRRLQTTAVTRSSDEIGSVSCRICLPFRIREAVPLHRLPLEQAHANGNDRKEQQVRNRQCRDQKEGVANPAQICENLRSRQGPNESGRAGSGERPKDHGSYSREEFDRQHADSHIGDGHECQRGKSFHDKFSVNFIGQVGASWNEAFLRAEYNTNSVCSVVLELPQVDNLARSPAGSS